MVGLTVGLLALFLRNADVALVLDAIRQARLDLLVAALLLTVLTYVLRAFRWQFLLRPIGFTRFSVAFRATVIGFAATFLLPARAGEFLRPYLVARSEHFSATATFATVVLERLLDLVAVMLFLGAFLLFFDPGIATRDSALYGAVQIGGGLAAVGGIVAFGLVFFLAGHPESLGRAAQGLERFLPARIASGVAALVQTFASGLAAVRQPSRLLLSLALSFPLWLTIAGTIWLVSLAFHIRLVFTGSFLLMALLVVGVAAPTPGAVGGFHEAYRLGAAQFFGAPNDQAIGAAIVLHAVSFVPVTLLGLVFMAQTGLDLRGMRRLAAAPMDAGADGVDADSGRESLAGPPTVSAEPTVGIKAAPTSGAPGGRAQG